MVTPIPRVQAGFRLFSGEQLNAIINQVNSNTISGKNTSNSALTTVGAGTLTAAILFSGLVTRTGPVAAYTDTTATGTAIDSLLGQPIVGTAFFFQHRNSTAFAATIAGGTGVTLSGRTVVTPNSIGTFLLTKIASNAYSMYGIDVSPQAIFGVQALIATADDGTTQTLTAAMVVGGMQTFHVTTGGTTPSLTLPLGTAMDTALPDMRTGQSYLLRVINTNSGTATIVTNTGWTLTGTLTLATNTWREFVVTKTGTGTYTGVQVGTGTTS